MRISIFFILVFYSLCLQAQVGSFYGKVQTDTSELTSVSLVRLFTIDSVLIKINGTDSAGNFIIYIPRSGEYKIQIEKPSYKTYYSNGFRFDSISQKKIDLGVIVLIKDTHSLAPVVVLGKKKFIERKFNKTIVNLEQSAFAQGNSLFELLPILPGIKIDAAGSVKINGKTNILFLVDGKGQVVPNEQATEMLKSISASTIEKIEIINNPSARYDASVGAVVNIITIKKKSKSDVHFGYGSQLYPVSDQTGLNNNNGNAGININTKIANVNVSSNLDYRKSTTFEQSVDNIDFKTTSPELLRISNSLRTSTNGNINFILGLNYDINKNQFIDLRLNTNQFLSSNNSNKTNINFFLPGSDLSDSSILSYGKTKNAGFKFNTANVKYVTQFNKAGEELAFYLDYNDYSYNRSGSYQNETIHVQPPYDSISTLTTNWIYKVSIPSFKTDYTYPINKNLFLDAGIKLSSVQNSSDYSQNQSPNNFKYKEFISAGYLSMRNENEKFGYEFGLRLENTHSNGSVLNIDSSLSRNYHNLFPTITTQYALNQDDNITLSYKTTIVRPTYSDFNPVAILYTPFYLYTGNNQLNPKLTKTLQFLYTHKNYALTLTNEYATNVKSSIIDSTSTSYYISSTVFSYRHVNQATIELDFPVKLSQKWSSNNSVSGYWTSALLPNGHTNNYTSFDLSSNHSFSITSSLQLNLILAYSYFDQLGYDKSYPLLNGIFAIQKSWKDKFILNINFNDIFGTAKIRLNRDYGYLLENQTSVNNNRNFKISLRYRFNSGILFTKKDKISKDTNDEIRF